jgi:Tfp pilus assembly protein PilX
VYRVTALAYGRKTNISGDPVTMVVLQETYAPTRRKD